MLTAIETTGTINANHQLELDEKLPDNAPERVRVIVLFDEKNVERIGKRRKSGSAEGLLKFSADFDEPLDGFEEYQP